MNYKVNKGTELFDKLKAIEQRVKECNQAAKQWVENNFDEGTKYAQSGYLLAGGLAGVKLDEKPKGYKSVGPSWRNLYAPYARNKKVSQEWAELPTMKKKEIKDVLNYSGYTGVRGDTMVLNEMPGLFFYDDVILIEASEYATSYKPVEGMVEILRSEFELIKEQAAEAVA